MAFRSVETNSETSNVIILSDKRPRANTAAFSNEDAQAIWAKSVSNSIAQLSALELGWDTYQGVPFSSQTLTFAGMVAAAMWRQDLPKPDVSATSSASVMLEWRINDAELIVEIHEPMRISYLLSEANGEESTGEATDSFAELKRLVAELLHHPPAVLQA